MYMQRWYDLNGQGCQKLVQTGTEREGVLKPECNKVC